MKYYFLLFCFFLLSTSAKCELTDITVSGTITELVNGQSQPVQGHVVTIILIPTSDSLSTEYEVISNDNGYYYFSMPFDFPVGDSIMVIASTPNCQGLTLSNMAWAIMGNATPSVFNFSICGSETACDASFSYSINPQNNEISFTNTSLGDGLSYLWQFGGISSTEENPTIPAAGAITNVCLTISSSNGCEDTLCETITSDVYCNAYFAPMTTGQLVIHPSAPYSNNYTYRWDISSDSSIYGYELHVSQLSGWQELCLTVSSGATCSNTYCDSVYFGSTTPCEAVFSATTNQEGTHFLNTSHGEQIFSNAWTFGDGSTSSQINPTHTFENPGVYMVCLQISTVSGCVNQRCLTVVIDAVSTDTICVAGFNFETVESSNLNYHFLGAYTSNQTSYIHHWNFGDGNSSTEPNPHHHFDTTGIYWVCHTVSNSLTGCQDSVCTQVNVIACAAHFEFSISPANPLFVEFTNASQPGNHVTSWIFGDGTSVTGSENVSHTFQVPGYYSICMVTENTTLGCSIEDCQEIFLGQDSIPTCSAAFTFLPGETGEGYRNYDFYSNVDLNSTHYWSLVNSLGDEIHFPEDTLGGVTLQLTQGMNHVCHYVSSLDGMCSDTVCQSIHVEFPTITIGGHISAGDHSGEGMVYLFSLDTISSAISIIAEVATNSGNYHFGNVAHGTYLIKVQPFDTSLYVSTYYGDVFYWANAMIITVGPSFQGYDLHLIEGSNPGGSGFVNGNIDAGQQRIQQDAEHPVPGASVIVTDLYNVPQRWQKAGSDGNFSITDLEFGTYYLWADAPGMICIPVEFTLSGTTPGITIQFFLGDVTSISTPILASDGYDLYPNPASNLTNVRLNLSHPGELQMEITSITGQTLLRKNVVAVQGVQTIPVSLDGLAAGTYIIFFSSQGKPLGGNHRLIVTK